jgi:hypothetical protein
MPLAAKRRKQSKPAEEATHQSSTDERADSKDATSPDESAQSSRQDDPRGGGDGSRDNTRSQSSKAIEDAHPLTVVSSMIGELTEP